MLAGGDDLDVVLVIAALQAMDEIHGILGGEQRILARYLLVAALGMGSSLVHWIQHHTSVCISYPSRIALKVDRGRPVINAITIDILRLVVAKVVDGTSFHTIGTTNGVE